MANQEEVRDVYGYFEQKGNALCYRYEAERVRIEPWGADSLRVRAWKTAEMDPADWALIKPEKEITPEIEVREDGATIRNGKIRAEINLIGKIAFYNQKGELLLDEYVRNRKDMFGNTCSSLEVEAREFKPITGGDYRLTMRFVSTPEEKIYGMGQYQQPYLDVKGADLELAHRNSQASVPFMLSSLGYGFLWNNPAVGRVNFGKNITTWEAFSSKKLDYWITAGDTPAEIEEAYANATGKVPMMPEYAMGFWQCKLRYQTQEELLEVAREYKRRNLPISVIVVDFFHWPMQGEWKFDPTYWPDPDAMIKELKDMGIELMVSIWPTVDYRSENFNEMKSKGLLIRVDSGYPISMDFQGNTLHYDATNPEAREYVWEKAKKNYYDKGVKVFWLDEAEPEYTVYDFENYRYHLGPDIQVGNIYPVMYAKTFFDGMKAEGQENIINLLRCAWAGSQKYGALVWSGDIKSSFPSMKNQVAAGLNMGIAGIPWWTSDIGGFVGGNIKDPYFKELLGENEFVSTVIPIYTGRSLSDELKILFNSPKAIECTISTSRLIHAINIWGAEFDENGEVCALYITDNNDSDLYRQPEGFSFLDRKKTQAGLLYKPVKRISDKYYMEGSIKGNYSFYINELNTLDLMRDKWETFFKE